MSSKLLALGVTLVRERRQEDSAFYDFPSKALRAGQKALRLRTAGRRTTLTFKGPCQKARSFKVREEFETDAANRGQLKKILQALGLQPVFGYRNYRTIFRKARLTIALDETTVGTFLELEGERHEITKFAKALGFSRADFITATYAELMEGKGNDAERL